LRGRIFFGSGALSDPRRYTDLVAQLDALPIGSHAAEWRGSSLIHWLEDVHGAKPLPANTLDRNRITR